MKQGWEYKKLGEVCSLISDGSHNPPKGVNHSTYRMISSQNVFDDNLLITDSNVRYITESDYLIEDKRTKLKNGVVLLTIVGTIGRSCVLKGNEGCLTLQRSVAALHPTDIIKSRFLMYSLIGNRYNLNKEAHGIAQKGIYLKQLSSLEIPLPPKSTQLSIVSELDKINELIRLKKEQLKDYDNLAQSIFYEMFGDPVENEKGWEVKKWKDVFNTILGKMLDKSKQINHLTQYKYLANMNVQWGYFDLKELRSMTFTDEELAKYELRKNDLLICEGGDAGRCAIWKETDETILFQKAIHRARLIDTDNANVVYIRYWMQFYKVNKGLKDFISKSTIEHLTGDKLKRLPIPLPPLSLQHLFAQRIEQIERQKSAVQKSITDLETLLASRMQYWFE